MNQYHTSINIYIFTEKGYKEISSFKYIMSSDEDIYEIPRCAIKNFKSKNKKIKNLIWIFKKGDDKFPGNKENKKFYKKR